MFNIPGSDDGSMPVVYIHKDLYDRLVVDGVDPSTFINNLLLEVIVAEDKKKGKKGKKAQKE
jgi:hypothetical protein